jgi:hypothetical protein
MTIRITIEFDLDGGKPVNVRVNGKDQAEPKVAKVAKVADVAPPPIATEPESTPAETGVKRNGSGPQFDPGFLAIVRDEHEPFTRRSLAVASGLKVEDVTQRILRLNKKGWIEQPAPGLWRKTKTFGVKPA